MSTSPASVSSPIVSSVVGPGAAAASWPARALSPISTAAPALARRGRFGWWAGAAGAALAAWLVLALWTPPSGWEGSLCLFRRHTHVPCPGCGLTRAFALLAKGDLAAAVGMHPLAPLLAAEALLLWLAWGRAILRGRALSLERWEISIAVVHLVLFGSVWLFRLVTGTLPS